MDNTTVHHALIFVGPREDAFALAKHEAVRLLGAPYDGNQDVAELNVDSLGIEESRQLKQRAFQAPIGATQVLMVVGNSITIPAQNALLKLLEEPPSGTYVFMVIPSVEQLLGTVLSRVEVRQVPAIRADRYTELVQTFLRSTPSERIVLLEPFYKKSEKDRKGAGEFITTLEQTLYLTLRETTLDKRALAQLEEVRAVRQYIQLPSSSLKLILEHLALAL